MSGGKGRVALVTGAARGQGRSHALALAREGYDIVACDIAADIPSVHYPLARPADLDETVALVKDVGQAAVGLIADMRVTAQVQQVVDRAIEEFGRIDVLIANHGICAFAPVDEMSDELWDELIDTNLTGIFKIIRAVVPHMRQRGYGRIVATASSIARAGRANVAGYATSKWGVLGLVKSAAQDVAGTGITINAVLPMSVNTTMIMNPGTFKLFCPELENPDRSDFEARVKDQFGKGYIEPEDVSRAVLYLVGDDAGVLNGQGLDLQAGWMTRLPI